MFEFTALDLMLSFITLVAGFLSCQINGYVYAIIDNSIKNLKLQNNFIHKLSKQ